MIKKYKSFEEAEEDILFQEVTLENLKRVYEVFEFMDKLLKREKKARRGIFYYKTWEELLCEEEQNRIK